MANLQSLLFILIRRRTIFKIASQRPSQQYHINSILVYRTVYEGVDLYQELGVPYGSIKVVRTIDNLTCCIRDPPVTKSRRFREAARPKSGKMRARVLFLQSAQETDKHKFKMYHSYEVYRKVQ